MSSDRLIAGGSISLGGALDEIAPRLAAAGIAESRREARLLIAEAAGLDSATIVAHPERSLTREQRERLVAFALRREAREPLSRILGWREFWSLRFALGNDTLDPRPDSETLVTAALEFVDRNAPLAVLDLGTGSGCLLLAFLSEAPNAHGLGIDLRHEALAVAAANARALGLAARARFCASNWGQEIEEQFDLVLCNPPYIPAGDIAGLAPEVAKFDPLLALDGGENGLAAYRQLSDELPRLLLPGALAIVEIGAGQEASAMAVMGAGGLACRGLRSDLGGTPRCLILQRPAP